MDAGEGRDTQHDGMKQSAQKQSLTKLPSLFSTKVPEQLSGGKINFSANGAGERRSFWAKKKKKKKREKEIPPKSHTVDKDEPKTDFGLE